MTAWLEVVSVSGPAWIQDLGRPGHMHEAVPPGGALVPPLLLAANAALGNAPGAAGIECFGPLRLRALEAPLRVSLDGALPVTIEPGAEAMFAPTTRGVAYVAVAGGVEVPLVLGGRGTLPVAELGGFEGRALRRGDRLAIGPASGRAARSSALFAGEGPIRVLDGPDAEHFPPQAFQALLDQVWRIAPDSDRAGLRLQGQPVPVLAAGQAASMPMVQGAIQVPPSGQPLVLGPDHPTTGGYPVLAVVIRADLPRALAQRAGTALRFRRVAHGEDPRSGGLE